MEVLSYGQLKQAAALRAYPYARYPLSDDTEVGKRGAA